MLLFSINHLYTILYSLIIIIYLLTYMVLSILIQYQLFSIWLINDTWTGHCGPESDCKKGLLQNLQSTRTRLTARISLVSYLEYAFWGVSLSRRCRQWVQCPQPPMGSMYVSIFLSIYICPNTEEWINFLDVTFDLNNGIWKPNRKPRNQPMSIKFKSNYLPI